MALRRGRGRGDLVATTIRVENGPYFGTAIKIQQKDHNWKDIFSL